MDSKALNVSAVKTVYASGHLLFVRGGNLMAQPFDPDRLATTGDAVPLAEHLVSQNFSASANGALIYAASAADETTQLTWYDRAGRKLGVVGSPAFYTNPALSPDGKRLAVSLGNNLSRDIWVFDLARGVPTRFTFDPKNDLNPAWSPDGSRIAFSSERAGSRDVFLKASSGAGSEELLVDSKESKSVEGWSPDGRFILYNVGTRAVWAVPVAGRRPEAVSRTRYCFYRSRKPDFAGRPLDSLSLQRVRPARSFHSEFSALRRQVADLDLRGQDAVMARRWQGAVLRDRREDHGGGYQGLRRGH